MAEPYLGEIRLFAGTYAPRGFAFCNGQLLSVAEYSALYSLLGTNYGGDGRTSFGLPEMRGRVVMGQGQGPGLSNRVIGQRFGQETVTLTTNQMPAHTHFFCASSNTANTTNPSNAIFGKTSIDGYTKEGSTIERTATLNEATLETAGKSEGHPNIQPILGLNYIICILGVYPSRN